LIPTHDKSSNIGWVHIIITAIYAAIYVGINWTYVRSIEPMLGSNKLLLDQTTYVRSIEPMLESNKLMSDQTTYVRSIEPMLGSK